jgi:hypothetical protein
MNIHQRKDAFIRIGTLMDQFPGDKIHHANRINPWFTEENIRFAISTIGEMLEKESVESFVDRYASKLGKVRAVKTIGAVMAGNIPLVGFHDFFCILMAGHRALVKPSSDDPELLKTITEMLISIEPGFREMIRFTDRLTDFDAVIATGSNNTSRYFESYFGRYPHIIRKNRNGLALLDGREDKDSLKKLGEDIFRYFGMGCRNVSKVFVPVNYDWQKFTESLQAYSTVADHSKYHNNYIYNRTIMMLNQETCIDTGFLLLRESPSLSSPLSVLHYGQYENLDDVMAYIDLSRDEVQCVVSENIPVPNAVKPGKTQHPALWDYADNVDTMEFLLEC